MTRLTSRPAEESDFDWLVWLRTETMTEYIEASGIEVDSELQRARVREDFDCIRILLDAETPVGMMKVVKRVDAWILVQIQIVPDRQSEGLGAECIGELIAQAGSAAVPLALSVLRVNPAKRLYDRMGFRVIGEKDHSFDMIIDPD